MKNKLVNFKNRFQHLPVAYTGLALGLGGLGNCLAFLFTNIGNSSFDAKWISYITISIVMLFLLIMFFKNVFHPKVLLWELKEPLMVSLLPTFSMSLMLVSGFIADFNHDKSSVNQIVGSILMIIALLIQFILIGFFAISIIRHHVKAKDNPMYGSYFVPTVGLITACTISNNFNLLPNELFQTIWYLGFGFYVLTFPVVTWNILFKTKCDISRFPSIAVWFAPTNLSPAGFIKTFLLSPNKPTYYNMGYLNSIFILTTMCGFVFSIILYLYIIKILTSFKFNPIFCSITFPCAIGATSMVLAAKYYKNIIASGNNLEILNDFKMFYGIVGLIFAIISTIIIFYILIRMLIIGYKILFTKLHDDKKHHCYQ